MALASSTAFQEAWYYDIFMSVISQFDWLVRGRHFPLLPAR